MISIHILLQYNQLPQYFLLLQGVICIDDLIIGKISKKRSMTDYEYLFKFIMLGDTSVGKSCLLLRFIETRFKNQHEATIGVQFASRIFQIKGRKIKLQIWDTAGQQSFKSITRAYYKGSIAAILVFDIAAAQTFEGIKQWLKQIRNHSHTKIRVILVGNKSDLQQQRQVSPQEIQRFMQEMTIQRYYQTSALSGSNVDAAFLELGEEVLDLLDKGVLNVQQDSMSGIKVNPKKQKKPTIDLNGAQTQLVGQGGPCAC